MLKLWRKLLTNNNTKIPLLYIMFNLNHYKNKGEKDSCMLHIHPELREDEHIKNTLMELVDYIRDKYDMEKM